MLNNSTDDKQDNDTSHVPKEIINALSLGMHDEYLKDKELLAALQAFEDGLYRWSVERYESEHTVPDFSL